MKNSSYDARLAEIREARLTEEVQNLRKYLEGLERAIVKAYGETFTDYAYTGPEAAVDLLAAEVKGLRKLAEHQAAKLERMDPHAGCYCPHCNPPVPTGAL